MYSEEHCVYKAESMGEADIVVAWLEDQGIAAEVKDAQASYMMQVPGIVAPAGVEVCVINKEDADRARALLREHFARLQREPSLDHEGKTLEAICEDCGKSSSFPYDQRATVQICPHCGEYLDVPDPEGDFMIEE